MILEKLGPKHKQILFIWRNNPVVWENSFNRRPITPAEHDDWFLGLFKSNSTVAYVASEQDKPVGIIRFDESDRKIRVSITIDPERHGHGLGSTLIKKGVKKYIECHNPHKQIVAEIVSVNIASTKAFEKAGFKQAYITYLFPR